MADSIDFDVSELNSLAVDITVHSGRAVRAAGQLVKATSQRVVATAQRFVPVDTSATKSSIHATMTDQYFGHPLGAEIGPTTEYAPHLEYGTVKMAPHAFMGPALDRETPDFVRGAAQIPEIL